MFSRFWRIFTLAAGLGVLALSGPAPAPGAAQEPVRPAEAPDTAAPPDSARFSARGALLRSLALPGWGQAYVGAPGRGAVYFALEAGSLWMVLKSRQQLAAAREQERFLHEVGLLEETQRTSRARARAQQVEDWITLSLFLLAFSGADAYVAAQLADFPGHLGTRPEGDGSLRLEASFPLRRRP